MHINVHLTEQGGARGIKNIKVDALNNGENEKERISPGEIRSLYSLIKSFFILVAFINTNFVINRNINI